MMIRTHLDCAGKLLDLSQPRVMGILNITPDSFSEVGRFMSVEPALRHVQRMVADGAAIIDIGGESTNPSVHPVASLQQELDRVIPVVEAVAREVDVPISVDTSKPEVMREAIRAGAGLINDIRGLRDPQALHVVAKSNAAVCLMHMSFPEGKSANSPAPVSPETMINRVKIFLDERLTACTQAGIALNKIVIDPGIGHGNFGKNLSQNLALLAHLQTFSEWNVPILVGVSRKTFLGELLNLPVEERLAGSLAAAVMAVNKGASIIRAHDVKATVEAVKVAAAILEMI